MFQQLLQKIALNLERRLIPYMVSGGQAALIYGESCLTRVIDIILGVGPQNLDTILEVIADLGWKVLVKSPQSFLQQTMVLPCQDLTSGIRIDLIFSFSPYEQQALQRVQRVRMGEAEVCFASLEDVIIHKIVAGRPRDLEDVRTLMMKNSLFNIPYIRDWLIQFEQAILKPCLEPFEKILEETSR